MAKEGKELKKKSKRKNTRNYAPASVCCLRAAVSEVRGLQSTQISLGAGFVGGAFTSCVCWRSLRAGLPAERMGQCLTLPNSPGRMPMLQRCSPLASVMVGSQEGNGGGSSDAKPSGVFRDVQVANAEPLRCFAIRQSAGGTLLPKKLRFLSPCIPR